MPCFFWGGFICGEYWLGLVITRDSRPALHSVAPLGLGDGFAWPPVVGTTGCNISPRWGSMCIALKGRNDGARGVNHG